MESFYKIEIVSLSYIIKFSLCVYVCESMLVRNRIPNHAYYSDFAFAGDSVGLGLGQRLNSIFKKHILMYFWGKSPLMKKILFTLRAGHLLIFVMNGDYEPI